MSKVNQSDSLTKKKWYNFIIKIKFLNEMFFRINAFQGISVYTR